MDSDHVLQGTGNEKELLLQTQLLSLKGLIVWIQEFKVSFSCIDRTMQKAVAHGVCQRHVEIIFRGDRRKLSLRVEKVIRKGSFEGFTVKPVRSSPATSPGISLESTEVFVDGSIAQVSAIVINWFNRV